MTFERLIRRYSAYYSGWCLAFGDHEVRYDVKRDINWLLGESKVGFALAPRLKRHLFRLLLGSEAAQPKITFADGLLSVGDFTYQLKDQRDREGIACLNELLHLPNDIHMYLSSHFCYPAGTRIITFSPIKPAPIVYKEIQPLLLCLE